MSGTIPISVRGVDFYYGDEKVLDSLTFAVRDGERLALVGENGSGKSTLLRVLAGDLEPDAGDLEVGEDAALLHQETTVPLETTVAEVVSHALAPVRELEAQLDRAAAQLARLKGGAESTDSANIVGETEQDAHAYDLALARAEIADVWNAENRADRVLAGLDLDSIEPTRRLSQLSGGQVRRLALAAMLIRRPRIMLLDEPTNHVDDAGLVFLQETLAQFPGAVVLSSHDREFLNQTATSIFDLDPFEAAIRDRARGRRGGETGFVAETDRDSGYVDERLYGGNYTDYLREKRQERTEWESRYAIEQDELHRLETEGAFKARDIKHRERRDGNKMGYGMRGNRVEKQVSRRIRAAEAKLEELTESAVAKPPLALSLKTGSLESGEVPRGKSPIIKIEGASVKDRLREMDLVLSRGDKLLITGSNGSGKSTLLGLIAGDLRASDGRVLRVKGLNVALLEQEVGLHDDERTPREVYDLIAQHLPDAAGILDYGLLRPEDIDKPLRHLSAGVRRRLILQLQIVQAPDVLVLDEPTNHLSLTLIEELSAAIAATDLTVIVATHDRWMRSTWPRAGRKLTLA